MEYQDRQLTCSDCGQPFTFTAGEQEFYAKKGFREEPKRCKPCREQRKVSRNAPRDEGGGGGDDDIGNRVDDGNRRPRGGGGRGAPRQMYDVKCDGCGADTQVPFQPTPGRAVYCRDCYAKQKR